MSPSFQAIYLNRNITNDIISPSIQSTRIRIQFDQTMSDMEAKTSATTAGSAKQLDPITGAQAKQLLLVLLQSVVNNTGAFPSGERKGLSCFGCGAQGVTKRTCPKCKTAYEARKGRRGFKSSANGNGRGGWKTMAPPSGESQTKEVKGRTFNWCAKCKRWSTTHSTATHLQELRYIPG